MEQMFSGIGTESERKRIRSYHFCFAGAVLIIVGALIYGAATEEDDFPRVGAGLQRAPVARRFGDEVIVDSSSMEVTGGGAAWALFERGILHGDKMTSGRATLMLSGCSYTTAKWLDVTNPTPLMLALVLALLGVVLRLASN